MSAVNLTLDSRLILPPKLLILFVLEEDVSEVGILGGS